MGAEDDEEGAEDDEEGARITGWSAGAIKNLIDIMYPHGYINDYKHRCNVLINWRTLGMNEIRQTGVFRRWLGRLTDHQGRAAILRRIKRARQGNFGDCKAVGEGVFEMRIPTGPGYRVYYLQVGERLYLLLLGGDKSRQQVDIDTACTMAADIKG